MELFYALDLQAIPREKNIHADQLAMAASTLKLFYELVNDEIKMEVIFRPSVPDDVEHWQVFNEDSQVVRFLNKLEEFEDLNIAYTEEGCNCVNDNVMNPIPGDDKH